MPANPTVCHVAIATERAADVGVNLLPLREEDVNLIAENFVDLGILRRDAAVEHCTVTRLAYNFLAAVGAPGRFAHPSSTNRGLSPRPHSITGAQVAELWLNSVPSSLSQP